MKPLLTLLLLCCALLSFAQTFEGFSTDEHKSYHCLFQLKPDSSVVFIFDRDQNGIYAEYLGRITRSSDSTYRVSAELAIGQFYMKSYHEDTLYITIDPQIAHSLDKIQVEFPDKKHRKQLQGYDRMGEAIPLLKLPIDKALFNANEGMDYVDITINRKNRLTKEWVTFRIPYGSAASITTGGEIEFEVWMEDGIIESVGTPLIQTGHIRLTEK